MIQIFNSRLDVKILIPIIVFFSGVFITSYFFLDHVRFRINNFILGNVGDNYQINKSLESFTNGGLLGQGLGNGDISKSLPDAHSDFIFALIGEEFGFLTIFLIICLYLIIYLRIFVICNKANNFFVLNSTLGLGNIFIFQTIINISTSINLLPTKGMTLPFISYGGSSFLSSAIIIGFVMVLLKVIKNE
jgi:cell division protein FtsW